MDDYDVYSIVYQSKEQLKTRRQRSDATNGDLLGFRGAQEKRVDVDKGSTESLEDADCEVTEGYGDIFFAEELYGSWTLGGIDFVKNAGGEFEMC